MSTGAYAPNKALWHLDSLAALRRGDQPVPKHVQLIVSDLCNQDCEQCLVAGTAIATPQGDRPIEQIAVGDLVYGPDGSVVAVTRIGSRLVSELVEVEIDGRRIVATAEHPFLTGRGWVAAGELCVDDSAVVRVRMRDADKVESQGMAHARGLQARLSMHDPGSATASVAQLRVPGVELERGLALRPITAVRHVEPDGPVAVYNFACLPIEAYEANGVVVHNCPYRMEGYSSNQHFGAIDKNGNFTNNPSRFIPLEKVTEILDDCAEMGVRAIQLTGGGEPTVHPQFGEIVRAVLDRGLELALVTNGVRFPHGIVDDLMRATWLRVSIDAGKPETYTAYRRCPPTHWGKMLDNVKALVEAKRRTSSRVTIGVGFVVARENHTEILDAVLLARILGVDNVRISAAFTTQGAAYHREIFEEAKRQAERAVKLSTPAFRVYDMLGDRVNDLEEGTPDYAFCGIQHFTTYIGGDQNVYRCCVTSYNDQGFLGSLKDQRLRDLWQSDEKRQRMQTFDARTCERCMFNQRNRSINAALAQPEHENFT